MQNRTAIVVGAGIVGLATARALAMKDFKVRVIERTERAVGASIRNFGMIWPIGQPDGELYESAILSRQRWKEIAGDAKIWYEEAGSLHLAYHPDEMLVLEELAQSYQHREYQLLDADETMNHSSIIIRKGLKGSLYSRQEMIVDPRIAIRQIPEWLHEKYGVEFAWRKCATDICYPAVYCGNEAFEADEIYICSGADFETLYPELFAAMAITKCKLQMMRMTAGNDQRIGPALCGGLSLLHYKSFAAAPSLDQLARRMEENFGDYLQWGIHVMISQNQQGELTVGDSHEYGLLPEPFDKTHINQKILSYANGFADLGKYAVAETWSGIYAKLSNGEPYIITEPTQGVTVINGLGGAGMTLSFGVCERLIRKKFQPVTY